MRIDEFLSRLKNVKQTGPNQYIASCPTRPDKHPSLSISIGKDGQIIIYDHGGESVENILRAMGLTMHDLYPDSSSASQRSIKAVYPYLNEQGELLGEKIRFEPKSFVWRKRATDGDWDYHRPSDVPPYNLPTLVRAKTIFLVEGEKDVDTLKKHGLPATCLPDGSMHGKWPAKYSRFFGGKDVLIIPDNDEVGQTYAKSAQKALDSVAERSQMVDLRQFWSDIPEKGDVTDYVTAKGAVAVDMLKRYIEQAENQMVATTLPVSTTPAQIEEIVPKVLKTAEDFCDQLLVIQPNGNSRYSRTDIGSGRLFADMVKEQARYVAGQKQWFVFDGRCWTRDEENLRVAELCKMLGDALTKYARNIEDEDQQAMYKRYAASWQNHTVRQTIIKEAMSVYSIAMGAFDNDPYLLNCKNGTLNLKSGKLHLHNPADMLTKVANVNYAPEVMCPHFVKFLGEIMSEDTSKSAFLQKALGYALCGESPFECMFMLYGETTRNGKSTLMESVLRVLGDYALVVNAETIAAKQKNSSGPSEDLARLAGRRFASISEPSRDLRLNAAQVKTMTGNDSINARFLHCNSFDFRPQFKMYLNTNYLPVVDDPSLFTSERIWVIPFTRHFEPEERDVSLKQQFAEETAKSAILNWLLEGWNLLQREGLNPPDTVIEATRAYSGEKDKISRFIADTLIKDDCADVRTAKVYEAYKNWCVEHHYTAISATKLNDELRKIGSVERKCPSDGGEKTTVLVGYRLKEEKQNEV